MERYCPDIDSNLKSKKRWVQPKLTILVRMAQTNILASCKSHPYIAAIMDWGCSRVVRDEWNFDEQYLPAPSCSDGFWFNYGVHCSYGACWFHYADMCPNYGISNS